MSPLRQYARRTGVGRTVLVPHNSFNSYFRPTLVSRRRCPLTPPRPSPRCADQQTSTRASHGNLVASPTSSEIYRKHAFRDRRSLKLTPSTRGRHLTPGNDGGGAVTRRRSVFSGGTAAGLSVRRRNTVVGGGTTDCPSPPTLLSLRDIYQLSRRGSVHNHHAVYNRQLATFFMVRPEKDCASSDTAGAVVRRRESGPRRRRAYSTCAQSPVSDPVSVDSGLRSDVGDSAALDVRRRRSSAYIAQHRDSLAELQSSGTVQPPPTHSVHDNAVGDTSKRHTCNIILVSVYFHTRMFLRKFYYSPDSQRLAC